jgi:RsiW-degrading membrane proteinase PrsW (M82 family)
MERITIKSAPFLMIIILSFIMIFTGTRLTINAADKLSNILLVVILTINQLILFYNIHNINNNPKHYKIYMILISILMTFALLYILYIKRIYDEERKIINQLKHKEIIEDSIITC